MNNENQSLNTCSYCAEQVRDFENSFYLKKIYPISKIECRNIIETKNFIVVPTIGPLTPGHILIIPKQHVTSIQCLSKDYIDEAHDILKKITTAIKIFSPHLFIFEHGFKDPTLSINSCVDHAHIHVLPLPTPYIPQIPAKAIKKSYLCPLDALQKETLNEYLMFSSDGIKFFYFDAKEYHSQ